MELQARSLLDNVIFPTLDKLEIVLPGSGKLAAAQQLIGTACAESNLVYLAQVNGPALGYYQIEPATHRDLWKSWLVQSKYAQVRGLLVSLMSTQSAQRVSDGQVPLHSELVTNLAYATVICRLIYWRSPEPMALIGDIQGAAHCWKRIYNTELGKGTPEHFLSCFPGGLARSMFGAA